MLGMVLFSIEQVSPITPQKQEEFINFLLTEFN